MSGRFVPWWRVDLDLALVRVGRPFKTEFQSLSQLVQPCVTDAKHSPELFERDPTFRLPVGGVNF